MCGLWENIAVPLKKLFDFLNIDLEMIKAMKQNNGITLQASVL